jgi:acyl-CoA reductase-like NAD-dependent aldehyde dehydrogenase
MQASFEESRLLIGGELRPASGGRTYNNINPATAKPCGVAGDASMEDAEAALTAARTAFDDSDWSISHSFRHHCIAQLQADLFMPLAGLSTFWRTLSGSGKSVSEKPWGVPATGRSGRKRLAS